MSVSDYDVGMLGREISDLKTRLDSLERGSRATQLQNTSLDTDRGKGYIPIFESGIERGRIGRMPDGTISMVDANNTTPPSIPAAPIVSPVTGGLEVTVQALKDAIPYDFRCIKVFCNGEHKGNIMRIPGSFIIAPLDGGTSNRITLTAVNTSGTESQPSTEVIGVPQSVVDGLLPQSITNTLIKDDAVTTPKVFANAITALKIAAAAVEADKIKAGAVTASKLEAILAVVTRLIAGNPTANRAEFSANGFEQYGPDGQLLVQLGAAAGISTANILTVIDQLDYSHALATLAANGTFYTSGLAVSGPVNLNGVDFTNIIANMPQGIKCYGVLQEDSPSTTSRIGVYELAFDAQAGRTYRFASSSFYLKSTGAGFPGGALEIRYTTDGSRPTLNSQMLVDASTQDDAIQGTTGPNVIGVTLSAPPTGVGTDATTAAGGADGHLHHYGANHTHGTEPHGHNHDHTHLVNFAQIATKVEGLKVFPSDCRMRILFSLNSYYGGSICLDDPDGDAGIQFYVEDIGPATDATGGKSTGDGSSTGGKGYNTKTYEATWTRSWKNNLTSDPTINTYMAQGRNTNGDQRVSMIGFDYNQIRADLAGSTVKKFELLLYSSSSYQSTGVRTVIGTHNEASATPDAYSYAQRALAVLTMGRPESKWINLPVGIGSGFRLGTVNGIVLDHRAQTEATDTKYIGTFGSYSDGSGKRPAIRITYDK